MRRTRPIKDAGPYTVSSCADGTLLITPTWPEETPGVLSRLALARHIEAFLNGAPNA